MSYIREVKSKKTLFKYGTLVIEQVTYAGDGEFQGHIAVHDGVVGYFLKHNDHGRDLVMAEALRVCAVVLESQD